VPYKDKDLKRASARRHYARNREKVIEKNNATRRELRRQWQQFKQSLACMICEEKHPATLDFHHIIPGEDKIYRLVASGAIKKAFKEIEKCLVLCANCHRKLHYRERYGEEDLQEE